MRTIALIGMTLFSGCAKQEAAKAPVSVEVVRAAPSGEVSGPGSVYPFVLLRDREADLSARVTGTLEAVDARIGDMLPRGAVVARIAATSYRDAGRRAAEDVNRLTRQAARNTELFPAGAISLAQQQDTLSALSAARAALSAARYDEASTVIRMPFPGVVLSRAVERGQSIAPGQAIARVADTTSPLLARVAVPARVAMRLRRGMTMRLSVGGGAEVEAPIRRVGAASDPQTGTVPIDVLATGMGLSGAIGTARLAGDAMASSAPANAGQTIPPEAVLDAGGGRGHVYVVDRRSTAQRVAVTIQQIDGDHVTVIGLAVGAEVITTGAGFVRDGQRVTVERR